MKAEFELSLDKNGLPCISFIHYERDNSLEQKTLKLFLDKVKQNGMVLKNTSGLLVPGQISLEKYEICVKE